jgi:hypothetical protein
MWTVKEVIKFQLEDMNKIEVDGKLGGTYKRSVGVCR